MIALFICVYLIGYVTAYNLIKFLKIKHEDGNWTVGFRFGALCLSVFSWISVLAVFFIGEVLLNEDKPASW